MTARHRGGVVVASRPATSRVRPRLTLMLMLVPALVVLWGACGSRPPRPYGQPNYRLSDVPRYHAPLRAKLRSGKRLLVIGALDDLTVQPTGGQYHDHDYDVAPRRYFHGIVSRFHRGSKDDRFTGFRAGGGGVLFTRLDLALRHLVGCGGGIRAPTAARAAVAVAATLAVAGLAGRPAFGAGFIGVPATTSAAAVAVATAAVGVAIGAFLGYRRGHRRGLRDHRLRRRAEQVLQPAHQAAAGLRGRDGHRGRSRCHRRGRHG